MDRHSFFTVQDGIQFRRSAAPFRQITAAAEYCFGDIRPEDVVVDIGANIGAFCLRAARTARRVTAVEPVACSLLRENIRLNGADVRVIEGALGDGKKRILEIERSSREKLAKSIVSAREIRKGARISAGDLTVKSPGNGLKPEYIPRLIGKIAREHVPEDVLLPRESLDW